MREKRAQVHVVKIEQHGFRIAGSSYYAQLIQSFLFALECGFERRAVSELAYRLDHRLMAFQSFELVWIGPGVLPNGFLGFEYAEFGGLLEPVSGTRGRAAPSVGNAFESCARIS